MVNSFDRASLVLASLALFLVLSSVSFADAQESISTVVTVSDMCRGRVKKITNRFDDEKDFAKVECSIERKRLALIQKDGVKLNANKVWEIMEAISKTRTQLVSLQGTFTSNIK